MHSGVDPVNIRRLNIVAGYGGTHVTCRKWKIFGYIRHLKTVSCAKGKVLCSAILVYPG